MAAGKGCGLFFVLLITNLGSTLVSSTTPCSCGTPPPPAPAVGQSPPPPTPAVGQSPPPPAPVGGSPPPPAPSSGGGGCPPPPSLQCSRGILKLGVCAGVLNVVGLKVGDPNVTKKCCSLVEGLVDLEAAVCLCTALKANVLGIVVNVDVAISILLNVCNINVPPGYRCA